MLQNEDADLSACLPCPFCGGRELSVVDGTTYQWLVVQCAECDARCGDVSRRGPEANAALVSEWNTRANMAALWKRCAKNLFVSGWTGAQFNAQLYRDLRRKHKSLKAENEALKNDARELAECLIRRELVMSKKDYEAVQGAVSRIIEATKEGE